MGSIIGRALISLGKCAILVLVSSTVNNKLRETSHTANDAVIQSVHCVRRKLRPEH